MLPAENHKFSAYNGMFPVKKVERRSLEKLADGETVPGQGPLLHLNRGKLLNSSAHKSHLINITH